MMRHPLVWAIAALALTACGDHGSHDHDHPHPHPTSGGTPAPGGGNAPVAVSMGSQTVEGYSVSAAHDAGTYVAGGELHLDVEVSGAPFSEVRAWIGSADGAGALKARGEIEKPDIPAHRHLHVAVPDPIPAGARVHVEVETPDGKRHVASFDPKP